MLETERGAWERPAAAALRQNTFHDGITLSAPLVSCSPLSVLPTAPFFLTGQLASFWTLLDPKESPDQCAAGVQYLVQRVAAQRQAPLQHPEPRLHADGRWLDAGHQHVDPELWQELVGALQLSVQWLSHARCSGSDLSLQ